MHYANTESMRDEQFTSFFESRVQETIEQFNLFDKKDPLLVAASGGKDSTVLLYVLKKLGYQMEAITINAHIGCYSDASLENLKKFCSKEEIKLHEISLEKEFGYKLCHIMAIMEEKNLSKTSCSICGTLRRYLLNKYGKKLGAKILLTGHNLDDETDGMTMALFMGNLQQVARIGLSVGDSKGTFVRRVKPLYFLFEDEVERYSKVKQFDVHYGWCPCSVKASRRFYSELAIAPEKKFNLVKNIIAQSSSLKSFFRGNTEVRYCSICEQPTSHDICQTCKIIATITDPENKKLDVSSATQRFEQQHNVCVPLIQIKQ